jgi:putative membrane protein
MNERIVKFATVGWLLLCLLAATIAVAMSVSVSKAQDPNSNATNSSGQNTNSSNRNTNSGTSQNTNSGTSQNANGAPAGSSASLNKEDRDFVTKAAMSGMKEVQLSQIAAQSASNDAVRQFAQRMVTDHTQANQQLMQLASSKGATLPATPDQKVSNEAAKLQGLSGAAFDKQYLKEAGVSEHEKAVSLFERQASSGSDPDLRAFATAQLPTLRQHLEMARSLAMGSTQGASGQNSNTGATGTNSNTGATETNSNTGATNDNSNRGTSNANANRRPTNTNANSSTSNENVNRPH